MYRIIIDWYFLQTKEKKWLGADANSRAYKFTACRAERKLVLMEKIGIKFEMGIDDWNSTVR